MENHKQIIRPFHLPLKKTSVIILVLCLFSFSIISAAAIRSIVKPQSLQSNNTHQISTNANASSQQNTGLISSGASNTPQLSISSSSADISVDFGNRKINTYPIPSTILGVGGVGLKLIVRNSSDTKAISQANFHLTKLGDYDFMSQIFPTATSASNPPQQDWTLFDEEMNLAANYKMQPIISLEYTPT